MADLTGAVAELDTTLVAARELVGPGPVAPLATELEAIRRRLAYLGDTVVVALAGGTGSGKSSLLNALAGEEVVRTGVLRPTTEQPLAWVPRGAEPELGRLLDDLAIDRRHAHDQGSGLAVVDLPDLDSVELTHRATVDALLPRIDLVLWVLDPQKYNDRAVHELIAARSGYRRQLLFALNQVDRLRPGDRDDVRADLLASLRRDGIAEPTVHLVAADPPDGDPVGVEELRRELRRRVADKRLVRDKLARDLAAVAEEVSQATGIAAAEVPDDLDARWEALRRTAAAEAAGSLVDELTVATARRSGARVAVAAGSGPAGRLWHAVRRSAPLRGLGAPQDAPTTHAVLDRGPVGRLDPVVATLTRGVTELSASVGGATGRALRGVLGPEAIERDVTSAAEVARSKHPPPRVEPRGRWRAVTVLQTIWTLAAIVGAVWWWSDPGAVRPGEFPWPPVLLFGGIALGLLGARLLRGAGARAGARAAAEHRERLRDELSAQLERRIGGRLDTVLDARRRVREGLRRLRGLTDT